MNHSRREVSTKSQWADFGSICLCQRGESSPRDATEDFTREKRSPIWSKGDEGNERYEERQVAQNSLLVAPSVDFPSGNVDAKEGTDVCTLLQARLPRCRDLPPGFAAVKVSKLMVFSNDLLVQTGALTCSLNGSRPNRLPRRRVSYLYSQPRSIRRISLLTPPSQYRMTQ